MLYAARVSVGLTSVTLTARPPRLMYRATILFTVLGVIGVLMMSLVTLRPTEFQLAPELQPVLWGFALVLLMFGILVSILAQHHLRTAPRGIEIAAGLLRVRSPLGVEELPLGLFVECECVKRATDRLSRGEDMRFRRTTTDWRLLLTTRTEGVWTLTEGERAPLEQAAAAIAEQLARAPEPPRMAPHPSVREWRDQGGVHLQWQPASPRGSWAFALAFASFALVFAVPVAARSLAAALALAALFLAPLLFTWIAMRRRVERVTVSLEPHRLRMLAEHRGGGRSERTLARAEFTTSLSVHDTDLTLLLGPRDMVTSFGRTRRGDMVDGLAAATAGRSLLDDSSLLLMLGGMPLLGALRVQDAIEHEARR